MITQSGIASSPSRTRVASPSGTADRRRTLVFPFGFSHPDRSRGFKKQNRKYTCGSPTDSKRFRSLKPQECLRFRVFAREAGGNGPGALVTSSLISRYSTDKRIEPGFRVKELKRS